MEFTVLILFTYTDTYTTTFSVVQTMNCYGTKYELPRYNVWPAKDFRSISESLSLTFRKSFVRLAKDFRTACQRLSQTKVCTTQLQGLYHAASRFVPRSFKVCTTQLEGLYLAA
ncbi:MAG: hypothetical protein IJ269_02085 [Bacteroidales bacterium]|nr:hypothetical protein [Bacteroidales bacterium]